METRTYKIPEFKLEGLRADFARLVKRAERLGAPSPVLTVAGEPFAETTIEVNEITGAKNTIVRVFYQVTVAGETPMLLGFMIRCSADEDSGYEGRHERVFSMREFCSYVVALARTLGFVSRKDGGQSSTADRVMDHMRPSPFSKDVIKPTDDDCIKADAALAWACELEAKSDFDHSLRTLARHGLVERKHFGIAAYLPIAYDRNLASQVKQLKGVSGHVGEIGKREVFQLTVTNLRTMETAYGLTTLVSFQDGAGHTLKWFCSGEAPDTFELGAALTVKATVKAHGDFKGVKETTLSRVAKYVEKAKAPKAPRVVGKPQLRLIAGGQS